MKPIYYSLPIMALAVSGLLSACSKKSTVTPVKTQVITVSTLAGTGSVGAANAVGVAASFNNPSSVVVSSSGVLFVGDWANNLVRKIDLGTGAVSAFAGTGGAGLVNGPAASAQFWGTANIAFDKSGNLFVADEENNVIREITAAGTVTTLAGSPFPGFHDGTGTAASFNKPEGLVADNNGNLYVVDGNNHSIRKIVIATGAVTTYSGTGSVGFNNGAVATATYHSPYGIAIDGNGDLYVADIVNNCVRKITVSTGVVSTFVGSGAQGLTNGSAASATFFFPAGVAFDSKGDLYISELRNNTVRKLTLSSMMVTTYAGSGAQGATDGPAATATFHQPLGLTFDSSDNLYVTDEYNNKIRKVSVRQ